LGSLSQTRNSGQPGNVSRCALLIDAKVSIHTVVQMRGTTMSAATTCEQDRAANVRASVVSSREADLLALARAGDSAAFESLVMPHWKALRRVTQRILRNREDAEDAVQNALLDAFRNLSGFQGRSQFSTWLIQIARNAAFMRLRVCRRERETSLDEVTDAGEVQTRFHPVEARPNPEQEYLLKESRILLEKGLERLDPLYAEVLHLRSVRELSTKEAAGLLELPIGTVKARLHRARVKLIRHTRQMLTHKRRSIPVKRQCGGVPMSQDSWNYRGATSL
jgi:RNA polymerase sigma-70 factor, ECF subfamily